MIEEKRKARLVSIIVVIIDILLVGMICGNHCSVPDQARMHNQIGEKSKTVNVAKVDITQYK